MTRPGLAERIKGLGIVGAVLSQNERLAKEPGQGDPFSQPLAQAMSRDRDARHVARMGPDARRLSDLAKVELAAAAQARGGGKATRAEKRQAVAGWLRGLPEGQLDGVEEAALDGSYGERQSDLILGVLDELRGARAPALGTFATTVDEDVDDIMRSVEGWHYRVPPEEEEGEDWPGELRDNDYQDVVWGGEEQGDEEDDARW